MSEGVMTPDPRHRVARFVASTRTDLGDLAQVPVWSMTKTETAATTLLELTRLRAQVVELELRVARHAAAVEVGLDEGAVSTASWWSHHAKLTRAGAHRLTRLAGRLADGHEPVRAALAAGGVLVDQAAVVVDAVDALPTDLVDQGVVADAERVLLAHAVDHDARALRVLGRRILDVVAPEEQAARAAASFTMVEDGHGQCHGRFTIPTLHGQMLRKHLQAHVPRSDQKVLTKHRLGEAFCDYVETRPAGSVGKAGGVCATVVVTMTLDTLMGGLRAASLDTGGHLSPGEARRLACGAGIIPAVLGGDSQVLDLGRKRRFHTEPQRIALAARDGGCTAEGCDAPPGRCHAHHDRPWSRGGNTDVKTGRLLCPRHHTLAHDPRYSVNPTAHGKLTFIKRT
jgi:hypothetical protein